MLQQFWKNTIITSLENYMGMTEVLLRRWVTIHSKLHSIKSHFRLRRLVIMRLISSSCLSSNSSRSSSSRCSNNQGRGQCLEVQHLERIQVELLVYLRGDLMEWGLNILEVEGLEMRRHSSSSSKISFKIESIANNISIYSSSQPSKIYLLNQIRITAVTHQLDKIFQSIEINRRVENSSNLSLRKIILIKVVTRSLVKFKFLQRSSLSRIKFKDFNSRK